MPCLNRNSFAGSIYLSGQLLNYLGDLIVNGRSVVGAIGPEPKPVELVMPQKLDNHTPCNKGLRNILKKQGPKAFADVRSLVLAGTVWIYG